MAEALAKIEPREIAPTPSNVSSFDPMAMIQIALENGQSPDMIDKLISLGERMQIINARKAFENALAAAKAEIPIIVKNAKGHNEKRYANFAAYAREIDPVLGRHGLSYRFRTSQDDRIRVTCVLSHRDGHAEENTLSGPPDNSGSKNAIQSIGSTLTYLQRYTLVQALGLAASEDDDGKAAGHSDDPLATITEGQADALRKALEFKGRGEEEFCAVMKVDALTDIPSARFDACMKAIQNAKEKTHA